MTEIQRSNYFKIIYNDVFLFFCKPSIDVFLCGGASTPDKPSYRDIIRSKLEAFNIINILYPEDLFMEILNRKKYNLLELEDLLADNSDYIVIVSESPGSFAELGAFANNYNTKKKTIVLSHTKFKNAKSFINQGPIQHIKDFNKNSVIYYNKSSIDSCVDVLLKNMNFYQRKGLYYNKHKTIKDINLITGQYHFIIILLYYFIELEVSELSSSIKKIYEDKGYDLGNYEVIFSAAVRRLFGNGQICKKKINNKSYYSLSNNGYYTASSMLKSVLIENKYVFLNRIRLDIMNA